MVMTMTAGEATVAYARTTLDLVHAYEFNLFIFCFFLASTVVSKE